MCKKDIYIENGVIAKIGDDIPIAKNTLVVDAEYNYILPGGVDPNTHMEMEMMGEVTADDFFTGTRAALAGGTTTIIDFAIPAKGESLISTYERYRKMAAKACCDYGFHVGVTWWSDKVAGEMDELCKRRGVNSFKTFMAFKDIWQLSDAELTSVFKQCRKLGAIALIHAEDGDFIHDNQRKILALGFKGPEGHLLSRPEDAEAEAIGRACHIACQTMCPLYVDHVMSKTAASVLAVKRKEGCVVFGETLVSALGTDGSHYFNPSWLHAAAHVVSPPLRPDPSTSDHLIQMLNKDGLQVVGSDHCVFSGQQKMVGMDDFTKIPTGTNGVEDRLTVTWEKAVHQGRMDPMRFVEVTSTNPAKIFNLYPKKGCIQVGSDADLVIWDTQDPRTISAQTHVQAVDFNIFEGMEVHGIPKYVFLRGNLVVDNGLMKAQSGMGRFLEMKTFPKHVYKDIRQKEDVINIRHNLNIEKCFYC
ncbi:dihydropyrimidinase [Anabrus simplex]|uniref:dihydropyrimidinase n=1 Tax=Anabrus simplex TaxID=316456 RepID=UPI0035A2D501